MKNKLIKIIDNIAYCSFAALAFFLPISGAIIEISFCLILLCFFARVIVVGFTFSKLTAFFKNRINLSLLVFYICLGLSVFVSGPFWLKSLRAWLGKWGEGVGLFYLGQMFLDKQKIEQLFKLLLAATFLTVINGLYQKITGVGFLRKFPLTKTPSFSAIRSSFNHYNDLAAFLVAIFFVNSSAFLFSKKNWTRTLLFCLMLLIVVTLFMTYSRGAWFSFFVVTFLIITFFSEKKEKLILLFFVSIFIVALMRIPLLWERFAFIFKSSGDADRFQMWKVALVMAKDSPLFGKGLGLFMDFFPNYSKLQVQYAHNCYLQILAEGGLLALISFLWFLGEIVVASVRKLREESNFLVKGFFFAVIAFIIHMFFDTQLYSLKLSMFFWLIISLLMVSINGTDRSKPVCLERD
ncbi:MAG: O-antigen ligase family protein [Candidatus Omnitrophica bacterium]|nr:O-antigen ligase family protein [Candidatus Omnitrophota bacterium]